MTRFDQESKLLHQSPAIALGWPSALIRKLDRAIRYKCGRKAHLTEAEATQIIDHAGSLDPERGTCWILHRNIQVVVSLNPPRAWNLR